MPNDVFLQMTTENIMGTREIQFINSLTLKLFLHINVIMFPNPFSIFISHRNCPCTPAANFEDR